MLDATDVRPLLEQCQGHDRIAFAELFEWYHQRVFRSAYVIAPRSEAADDITQLVFVELFAGAVAVALILLALITHGVQNAMQTIITTVKQIASGTSDSGTPPPQGTLPVPMRSHRSRTRRKRSARRSADPTDREEKRRGEQRIEQHVAATAHPKETPHTHLQSLREPHKGVGG